MARFVDSAKTERMGITHIATLCAEIGYIWRETPNSDVGFDGEIELVIGGQATGQIIKVQSRAGKSYIRNEKDESFDFYTDANELEYWQNATNPVILITYNPDLKTAYWVNIKKYIINHPEIVNSRPHKITINKTIDLFDKNTADDLLELFEASYTEIEAAYNKHIIDRFSKLTLYSVNSDAPIAVELEKIFVTLTATQTRAKGWRRTLKGTIPIHDGSLWSTEFTKESSEIPGVNKTASLDLFLSSYQPTPFIINYGNTNAVIDYYQPSLNTINDALKDSLSIVIIGAPGAGKTTLLKYLALTYSRKAAPTKLDLDEHRLPIFVALRDFSRFLDNTAKRGDLVDIGPQLLHAFIINSLRVLAPHLALPNDFFSIKLKRGDCIILLDGLDEVAEPLKRARVAEAVAEFTIYYPNNRVVITSRPRGYEAEIKQRLSSLFTDFLIEDFNDSDMKKFTENWYEAVTRDRLGDNLEAIAEAKQQAGDLLRAIYVDQRVKKLAHNPLLLSVLAMVHQRGVGLPQRRAELYDECTDLLLGYWDQTKGGEAARDLASYGDLDRSEKRALLEPIALWFHERGAKGLEADKEDLTKEIARQFTELFGDDNHRARRRAELFLQVIDERAGLIVELETGIYSFAHLSFQEYLTARAIANSEDYIEFTLRHLHEGWWREVILLEIGHLSDVRHFGRRAHNLTTRLVEKIHRADSPLEAILKRDLLLAARALADVGQLGVNDTLRQMIWNEVFDTWLKTPYEPQQREIIELFDYSLPTTEGRRVERIFLDCLRSENLKSRIRGCHTLTKMSNFIITNDISERLFALIMDSDEKVRDAAIDVIVHIGNSEVKKEAIRRLLQIIVKSEIAECCTAITALSLVGSKIAPKKTAQHLILLTKNEDSVVRFTAVTALINNRILANNEEVQKRLEEIKKDPDSKVRDAAIKAGELTHLRRVSYLLGSLHIDDKELLPSYSELEPDVDVLNPLPLGSQPLDIGWDKAESLLVNNGRLNISGLQELNEILAPGERFQLAKALISFVKVNDEIAAFLFPQGMTWMGSEGASFSSNWERILSKVNRQSLTPKTINGILKFLTNMLFDPVLSIRIRVAGALGYLLLKNDRKEVTQHLVDFWKSQLPNMKFMRFGIKYERICDMGYEQLRRIAAHTAV